MTKNIVPSEVDSLKQDNKELASSEDLKSQSFVIKRNKTFISTMLVGVPLMFTPIATGMTILNELTVMERMTDPSLPYLFVPLVTGMALVGAVSMGVSQYPEFFVNKKLIYKAIKNAGVETSQTSYKETIPKLFLPYFQELLLKNKSGNIVFPLYSTKKDNDSGANLYKFSVSVNKVNKIFKKREIILNVEKIHLRDGILIKDTKVINSLNQIEEVIVNYFNYSQINNIETSSKFINSQLNTLYDQVENYKKISNPTTVESLTLCNYIDYMEDLLFNHKRRYDSEDNKEIENFHLNELKAFKPRKSSTTHSNGELELI